MLRHSPAGRALVSFAAAALLLGAMPGLPVSASWTVPADGGSPITGYRILRATGVGTASVLAQVASSTTSYRDTTARRGTTYTYTVRALNAVGEGASSSAVTVTAR